MKILIIGGTKFLGRHLVDAALKNNHEVTLFNRGKHSSEKFENVEQIHGDRNEDLDKLENQSFDVCIDTCGYLPQTVKISAEMLKDSVERYVFVSSISAYADFSKPDFDETAPTANLTDEQKEQIDAIDIKGDVTAATLGESYGAAKILCEREVEKAFPDKNLIVRSGLIVGAFDLTDRFTYWVMRVAEGGEVLAPGNPNRFVQLIDARDLSEWIIKAVENGVTGTFHATGRPFELTMEKLLEEIKAVSGNNAVFTWVGEEFLEKENVAAWSDMPLYQPESDANWRNFLSANINKALQAKIEFRPLSETIREILNWRKTQNDELKAGISAEREIDLLGKWREQE